MIDLPEWLKLVRFYLKKYFNYSDKEIDRLFSENMDVIVSDYNQRLSYMKENPEWTNKEGWVSAICSCLHLLY